MMMIRTLSTTMTGTIIVMMMLLLSIILPDHNRRSAHGLLLTLYRPVVHGSYRTNINNNRSNSSNRRRASVHWGGSLATGDGRPDDDDDDVEDDSLLLRLEGLQNELMWIEALEERNLAQLDSFVDVQHQWESLDNAEKELLSRKQSVLVDIDKIMKKKTK